MLHGDHVVLRPFRPEDVEPLWRVRLDPQTWAQTTEKPYVPEPLAHYRARFEAPGVGDDTQLAVEVDGELAGRAGLFGIDALARSAEVGLTLLEEHRGRGHGRDVLRVLLGLAFRTRNLHRVHLQTLASNEPALRCYRAAGFVEEGRQRDAAWVEGRYDDVVLLSVLRAEWQAGRDGRAAPTA